MNRMLFAVTAVVAAWAAGPVQAAAKPTYAAGVKSVTGRIEPAEAKPGQTVQFLVTVELNQFYYTYPTVQPQPKHASSRTVIDLPPSDDLLFVEPVADPAGAKTKKSDGQDLAVYPGGVTWSIPAVVSPTATAGDHTVALKQFKMIVCYDDDVLQICLRPQESSVAATVKVLAGPAVEIDSKYKDAVARLTAPPVRKGPLPEVKPPDPVTPPQAVPSEVAKEPTAVSLKIVADRNYAEDMAAVAAQLPAPTFDNVGFFVFLLTAAGWGFVTLLTPCVFPMVPITVSVFIRQSQKQGTNPLVQALIYAGTIVVVLGVAAMTLLSFFSNLATDPYMNVALGTLFVVLALSLFGLFDLTLPSWLVNLSANREGRGGYLGTVFMAVSFTMVSFTCVAPFLGGFGGMAASGNFGTFQLLCGGLAFAGAFASPFFLLALFPSLLKKLPKSGGWMNTIKVVMGFLELAAALKFFRTAELRWTSMPTLFTYDLVLSLWVVLFAVAGLYLLGLYKLPHDHDTGAHHIGPFRLMTAIGVIGFAVYLLPGLFSNGPQKNRPNGTVYAWVDAFLLPEPTAGSEGDGELAWSGDLRRSLDDARGRNGYVFVDFTAKTCNNCRLNEREVFAKPEFQGLLKRFIRVALYTDDVPAAYYDGTTDLARQRADGTVNAKFEKDAFGAEQLPLYVILKPEAGGKTTVVGVYGEGLINDVPAFRDFLKKPFEKK